MTLWRPAVGRRTGRGPASGSRPAISTVVESGAAVVIRPSSVSAGPAALWNRSEIPRAKLPSRCGEASTSAVATIRPGQSARRVTSSATPAVADVRHEHRSGVAVTGRRPPDPGLERREHGRAIGEDVRVVPLGGGEHDHVRPVGVEVAGVLVRLDDERLAGAPARRRGHADARQGRGQQGPDEGARIAPGGREDVHEPPGRGALAVGPRDADQPPTRGRVGDDLLPRLDRDREVARGGQLGVARIDRREGLGHREPGRRTAAGAAQDVRGVVGGRDLDARRRRAPTVYGPGPPGSQPSTAAPAQPASSAAADAPAPAAPTTWIRSPARIGRASRAAASPAPTSAAPRTVTAASSGRTAELDGLAHRAASLPCPDPLQQHLEGDPRRVALVLGPIAGPQEPPDHGDRRRPTRRRTRARPAWPRSRRRDRRRR